MLRGAIICPDRELGDRLVGVLLESHRIGIVRRLDAYPNQVDLGRFLRAAAPEIVFLSIETRQQALETAKRMEELAPGLQVVAINRTCDPPTLLETMRAGIREFLSPPFEHQALAEALERISELISQNPPVFETTDSVFAFLPAKAGSGATTIAVNTSLAMSRMPDTERAAGRSGLELRTGRLHASPQPESVFDRGRRAETRSIWMKICGRRSSRPKTDWTCCRSVS